jgi:hypothetical protein
MSGSDASYHDDDDDDDDDGGRGAENLVVDKDVNDADDAAAHEEELAQSLRKMGKIVNNLIARADSVPFREPGEALTEDKDTMKGPVLSFHRRVFVLACVHLSFFNHPCYHFFTSGLKSIGRAFR